MRSHPSPKLRSGRDQRLAGLRRSLSVALEAPAARNAPPERRRALVRTVARPQLEAAVTAGALDELEARALLRRLEERYAARPARALELAGAAR